MKKKKSCLVSILVGSLVLGAGCGLLYQWVMIYLEKSISEHIASAKLATSDLPVSADFRYEHGWIIVDAAINDSGKTYSFLVDTGAQTTCLFRELVDELSLSSPSINGLKAQKRESALGNSAKFETLDKLSFGELMFTDVGAIVLDDDQIGELRCYVTGGVIGINVLCLNSLQIDYQNKRMTFGVNIEELQSGTSGFSLPLKKEKAAGRPYVNTKIETEKELSVLVDTGYSGGIRLSLHEPETFVRDIHPNRIRAFKSRPKITRSSEQKKLILDQWSVLAKQISVGPMIFEDLLYTLDYASDKADSGIMGNRILQNYCLSIDWDREMLHLNPNGEPDFPTNRSVLGLTLGPVENQVFVQSVYDGSVASRLGITLDDQVISINDHDVSNLSDTDCCLIRTKGLNLFSPNDQEIKLVLRRKGKDRPVTLNRFSVFPD